MRARAYPYAFALVFGIAACQSRNAMEDRASPTSCVTCHAPEYKAAKDHEGIKPSTCGICHSQMVWTPSRIDHPWPLTGKHANNNCLWCHRGEPPKFAGTKKECWGCHKKDFEASTFENHETFQHTCDDCHSTQAFSPALENAKIPPTIPTVPPIAVDSGVPPIDADAGGPSVRDGGPKIIPTVIPTVKLPPKKKDAGVDIITHPSHHGGGEEE